MKILTVAFMLLFNYLDTLPKLYTVRVESVFYQVTLKWHVQWMTW